MIPKSRTDKLFGTGSSGLDEDVDAEKDIEFMDSTSHDEVSSAAKSRTSSTKKVKPQSKERSVRRGRVLYPEDDQFNKFMSMVMKNNATKTKDKEEDKELQDTMRMSKLMTALKEAKEAMRGPIIAKHLFSSWTSRKRGSWQHIRRSRKKKILRRDDLVVEG